MSSTAIAAGNRRAVAVPVVLTTAEAAAILRWNPQSVTRAYREGRLSGGRVGKRLLLTGESVAAYLTECGIPAEVVAE